MSSLGLTFDGQPDAMFLTTTERPNGTPTWVGLHVPDLAAAQAFYHGLFGWEIVEASSEADEFLIARKNGLAVAGFQAGSPTIQDASGWITYLATDNINRSMVKIASHGGRMLVPPSNPMDSAMARTAIAQDVGGAIFGLWQVNRCIGMDVWSEAGAVKWNENFTHCPAENKVFYATVFDNIQYTKPFAWHFGDSSKALPNYTIFSVNGQAVGEYGRHAVAGIGELDPEGPIKIPHWMTCFATLDMDKTLETLTRLGGTVLLAPYETMFGPLAIVRDNQDAAFMLAVKPNRG